MHDAIATIPMNPSHAEKIGFYSIFVYLSRYAQSNNVLPVYGINTLGKSKLNNGLPKLKASIQTLGIEPKFWWVDESLYDSTVSKKVQDLYNKNILQISHANVSRCVCGNVEYLSDVVLRGTKTLLHGKHAVCCDSKITSTNKEVLLTAPLPHVEVEKTYPAWAGTELNEKLARIAGNQLLVSRTTTRRYQLETNSHVWQIDNDLSWWLYSFWLYEQGIFLKDLVIGASVLHQAAILIAFSSLLGIPVPTGIHCLPKVYFQAENGTTSIGDAVALYGQAKVTNSLLWCALSGRKEITFLEHMFKTMSADTHHECSQESRKFLRA